MDGLGEGGRTYDCYVVVVTFDVLAERAVGGSGVPESERGGLVEVLVEVFFFLLYEEIVFIL